MQDLANKGQDSGRCPVCGKVYQWKLLNHVAKDHLKVLKPAHLSYKCTVCTATFGQYKLFENHVYTAHSGANKRGGSSASSGTASASSGAAAAASAPFNRLSAGSVGSKPIKISDEITIIPQQKSSASHKVRNRAKDLRAALVFKKKKKYKDSPAALIFSKRCTRQRNEY